MICHNKLSSPINRGNNNRKQSLLAKDYTGIYCLGKKNKIAVGASTANHNTARVLKPINSKRVSKNNSLFTFFYIQPVAAF
jgi:hypothetical protein